MPDRKEQLDKEKQLVAQAAMAFVKSGMKIGLGSGTTSHYFVRLLGEKVRAGELKVEAVASSRETAALAQMAGITLMEPQRRLRLDLAVDGADEIAPDLSLIKGGGGAHLREKVVVAAAAYFLVIADSSKLVQRLGAFPVPLEVIPFAAPWVMDQVEALGGMPVLRMERESVTIPCLTDQQNYILDCRFPEIDHPAQLAAQLEKVPGVVEHGLFVGYARAALIAQGADVMLVQPSTEPRPLSDFRELP